MIPEYRPPHRYPLPEPESAGQPSTVHRKLLAVADEIIAAKTDEVCVLDEALAESWTLIRELRAQVDAQAEQIETLTEIIHNESDRWTREYEEDVRLFGRAS